MPFYRVDVGDGQTIVAHFNFGGRQRGAPKQCVAPRFETDSPTQGERCGRMSVALCDYPVGQDLDGTHMTCDAPMCDKHRTVVGRNKDHCPRHSTQARLPETV